MLQLSWSCRYDPVWDAYRLTAARPDGDMYLMYVPLHDVQMMLVSIQSITRAERKYIAELR